MESLPDTEEVTGLIPVPPTRSARCGLKRAHLPALRFAGWRPSGGRILATAGRFVGVQAAHGLVHRIEDRGPVLMSSPS
jgi:hypothetical protein